MGQSDMVWVFVIVSLICFTVCRVAAMNIKSRERLGTGSDDLATIQRTHRGLQKMEERLEALETIIMDSHRSYAEPDHGYRD